MGSHNNIHDTGDDNYYYCPRPDCPCHGAAPGIIFVHFVNPDDNDFYRWAIDQFDRLFGSYDPAEHDDDHDHPADHNDLEQYHPDDLVADINQYLRTRADHPTNKPPADE